MRKILIATIAVILMMSLAPLAISASPNIEVIDWDGDGDWSHGTWSIDLYPGEEVSMELKIESSEDAVVYIEYDMPRDLFIYFDPPAFEIEEDDSEWVEVTVYAPGDIEPDKYEIDFNFRAIPIETEVETETVYRNKYLPGTEKIEYVDRIQYVDQEVIKYVNVQSAEERVDWWWIPISIMLTTLVTLLLVELTRRREVK